MKRWQRWFDTIVNDSSEESNDKLDSLSDNRLVEDMEVPNEYPIHLFIAENEVTVRTTRQAEEFLRMAAQKVDQLVERYKEHNLETSKEQLLIFAALRIALENIQRETCLGTKR